MPMPDARRLAALGAGVLCLGWSCGRVPSPTAFLMYGDWGHQMAGANQVLAGEHPFVDFKSVYGPLVFYASAAGQWLTGGRPIGEMALVVASYALAYGLLFRLFREASGGLGVAVVFTLFGLVLQPPLYKYYVVLGPVLTLTAAWRLVDREDARSYWLLAAAVAATGLYRADVGVFAAIAAAAVPLTRAAPAAARLRSTLGLGLAVSACASPWLVWAAWRGGLVRYFSQTISGSLGIAAGMSVPFPRFDASRAIASIESGVFLSFVVFLALPALALLVMVATSPVDRPTFRKIVSAALLAQGCLVQALHRSDHDHLVQALPTSLVLGAWIAGRLLARLHSRTGVLAGVFTFAGAIASPLLLVATHQVQQPTFRIATILERLGVYAQRPADVLAYIERLHPGLWIAELTRYARTHSEPGQRILALPSPLQNVYYFAERPFAGGQLVIAPGAFSSEQDQRALVERLEREPLALVLDMPLWSLEGLEERKARSFAPILWAYLTQRFPEVKAFGRGVVRTPASVALASSGPDVGRAARP
jgi:hypothetical protein